MTIYDITKELFSTETYPGDPVPAKSSWLSMSKGDKCNLTSLSLGSHSGTHIDAPKHFIANGKDVSEVSLEYCIGSCQVIHYDGRIKQQFWSEYSFQGIERILFQGQVMIDETAAENIVRHGIKLIGVETPTVGDKSCQENVHKILLEKEIVILENLQLNNISEGRYFLLAQPLKMQGSDGSPVRALLITE